MKPSEMRALGFALLREPLHAPINRGPSIGAAAPVVGLPASAAREERQAALLCCMQAQFACAAQCNGAHAEAPTHPQHKRLALGQQQTRAYTDLAASTAADTTQHGSRRQQPRGDAEEASAAKVGHPLVVVFMSHTSPGTSVGKVKH